MEIVKKLIDIREALGYTQEQMADILGVSQPTINRTESGSEDNIKIGRIKSYCKLAGITLEEYFCNNCIVTNIRSDIAELAEVAALLNQEQVKSLTQFIRDVVNNSG